MKESMTAVEMFEVLRKESAKWREANDAALLKLIEMIGEEKDASNKKLDAISDKITKIEKQTKTNSTDIAFVNDIKLKAAWGWNTAKYLTMFFAGLFAFFAGIYHLYEFLKNYFKGA